MSRSDINTVHEPVIRVDYIAKEDNRVEGEEEEEGDGVLENDVKEGK
jgi:hypothetical protein